MDAATNYQPAQVVLLQLAQIPLSHATQQALVLKKL
jgi:hypothetical protein